MRMVQESTHRNKTVQGMLPTRADASVTSDVDLLKPVPMLSIQNVKLVNE